MSFSSEVKEELSAKIDSARHCRIAQAAAMLHACGWAGQGAVGIRTENAFAAKAFGLCLSKIIGREAVTEKTEGTKRGGSLTVRTASLEDAEKLLSAVRMDSGEDFLSGGVLSDLSGRKIDHTLIQKSCCKKAFIRGAFLTSGSLSDPRRSYHFEIVCHDENAAALMAELLSSLSFDARCVTRKPRSASAHERHVVYLKEGEQISDLLGAMGAYQSLMALENARIVRNIAGTVNRQVNCETANLKKTVDAAVRQTEDIRYLDEKIGLGTLSEPLRAAAYLRLEMPDATLSELSAASDPPVGKSGINHRLGKLSRLAAELRNREE